MSVLRHVKVLRQSELFLRSVLKKRRERGMSSAPTHMERTADSSRDKDFSWVSVSEIARLSPTVKKFTLAAEDKKLSFLAGQWVDLLIPEEGVIVGYSMVSPPHLLTEEGFFQLAIKYHEHPPTFWMSTKCTVGDRLKVRVGGDFHYSPPPGEELEDLLLIGGGVGINPLFSMLSHHVRLLAGHAHQTKRGRVRLLYSSKTKSELLFKDRIDGIASSTDKVKVQFFTTAEEHSDSSIKCCRVSSGDVCGAVEQLDRSTLRCYVCGPPPMTETITKTLLEDCGLRDNQIHYEKWW